MKRKTDEEFKQQIKDTVGNDYIVADVYINSRVKIKFVHMNSKCSNYEFYMTPNAFINGNRCPKCSGKMKYTTESYKEQVYEMTNGEYIVLGEYKEAHTKILMQHMSSNCNNFQYEITPHSFRKGTKCAKCQGLLKRTQEIFKLEVQEKVGTDYIILSEYQNTDKKVQFQHANGCGAIFFMTPKNFLVNNQRCPKCPRSKGEESIANYLNKNKILYQSQYRFKDCKYKRTLPFDFAIFKDDKLFCLIEFDGKQHFEIAQFYNTSREEAKENYENTLLRDKIKNQYCQDKNIPLLRIPYWDFDNMESIIENYLREKGLGKNG